MTENKNEMGYWNRVANKAFKKTIADLGFDTPGRTLWRIIAGMFTIALTLFLLQNYGSDGAWMDETISKIAPIVIFPFIAAVVFIVNFVKTPGEMEKISEFEWSACLNKSKEEQKILEEQLSRLPDPEFICFKRGDRWVLRIKNISSDAEFTAMIDLSQANIHGAPKTPHYSEWVDLKGDKSKFIPEGGWNDILLFETEHRYPLARNIFFWQESGNNTRHTTSWFPGRDKVIKPKGYFTVHITSKPRMRGGARRFCFEYEGFVLSTSSTDVQILDQ
ncbi:MAG: hypothetical protein HC900_10840 [Methylacidiphilales bacterium]|nr:hypothetical protein [Candidatus Methylacidiphilales bacterium]